MIKPLIFACNGASLHDAERDFFSESDPLGFILFKRNIESPEQVQRLICDLKQCCSAEYPLILVDQEGGRVVRFKPPHWRQYYASSVLGKVAQDNLECAKRAAFLKGRLIGDDLLRLGINVDCAPVIDIHFEGTDDGVIASRSFGRNIDHIVSLSREMINGLHAGGVMSMIKHLPGHGRTVVDSHKGLPTISVSKDALDSEEFKVIRDLSSDRTWGMVAHIIYTALDKDYPSTFSKKVMDVMKNELEFHGVLFSDAIEMNALSGSMSERAQRVLSLGCCDVAVHCTGKLEEMRDIVKVIPDISDSLRNQIISDMKYIESQKQDFGRDAAEKELNEIVKDYIEDGVEAF